MTAADIMREVAAAHGLTVEQIKGRSHAPKLVAARIEIAMRLKAERGLTSGQIGAKLGRSSWTIRYYLDCDFRRRRIAQAISRWHVMRAAA